MALFQPDKVDNIVRGASHPRLQCFSPEAASTASAGRAQWTLVVRWEC